MGVTQWSTRDSADPSSADISLAASQDSATKSVEALEKVPQGYWWFFGVQPQGDAQALFQSITRALGLGSQEWSWKNASDDLNQIQAPENGLPIVVLAFGGSVAQKITGERDSLPQLRETILALNNGADDEIPVIASFDLAQMIAKPKDKALLWQDLLLAKSVLQNI